jgi:hypothetical protein
VLEGRKFSKIHADIVVVSLDLPVGSHRSRDRKEKEKAPIYGKAKVLRDLVRGSRFSELSPLKME